MEVISGWLHDLVLPGLGTLLMGAALVLARRYIKRLDDERLRQLLLELVRAAEQIYGPGAGAQKRAYVMGKLGEYGRRKVDRDRLEAAVYEVTGD